jgi:hypothetical protein
MIAERLRFHPLVPSDLLNAIQWYDDISDELGNRFREMADARFDDIESNPQGFARAFDEVSFAQIQHFPYLILFREMKQAISVLGVFHIASDPEKWRGRAAN